MSKWQRLELFLLIGIVTYTIGHAWEISRQHLPHDYWRKDVFTGERFWEFTFHGVEQLDDLPEGGHRIFLSRTGSPHIISCFRIRGKQPIRFAGIHFFVEVKERDHIHVDRQTHITSLYP
ncbi:MAG: hypothetical protein WEA04_02410 [Candidatus Andersenbacteria bacterium]